MGRATKGAQEAGLNDQQEAFCREYVARLNAKDAAIAAGYSTRSAMSIGAQLLQHPKVAARIAELQAPRLAKLDISADRVLNELARVAFARIDQVLTFGPSGVTPRSSDDLSEDVLAAVAEASQTLTKDGGSIRIKLHDKLGALNALGKHLKLWQDDKPDASPWDAAVAALTEEQAIARAERLRAARLAAQEQASTAGASQ